ncbi:unnamed protein product [Cuscuta epithymum]|nr:unnamed protein product [Cuscuta epithymum]
MQNDGRASSMADGYKCGGGASHSPKAKPGAGLSSSVECVVDVNLSL